MLKERQGLLKEGRIGLIILFIGLINIYNIIKYGAQFSIYSSQYESIIRIDERKIKEFIIIIAAIYSIFYILPRLLPLGEREHKKEYDYTLIMGIIGITMIIFGKELILIYIGIELYNFTNYVIILGKENIKIRKIAIIYLILSSLSSAIFLLFILLLYYKTGSFNIETIRNMNIYNIEYEYDNLIFLFFSLSFFFKIGSFPFIHWILSLYSNLERKVILYQLIVPKFFYYFLFFNLSSYCLSLNSYPLFLLFLSFSALSILISSFSGINPLLNKYTSLLTYSSILNTGLLLLLYSFLYFFSSTSPINYFILYNFFLVYILNSLGLFSFLSLPSSSYSSLVSFNLRLSNLSGPFLSLSLIFLIFSFIGIPPFSGFFAKFYLFIYFTYFLNSSLFFPILAISLLILSTILSSLLYLKFLTPKVSSNLPSISTSTLITPYYGIILLLSFCSLFSIFYTYYIPFILTLFLS